MVQLEAEKHSGQIVISEDSFEHLLNCLDHQKFIGKGGDQVRIDDFNKQCRRLLHDTASR